MMPSVHSRYHKQLLFTILVFFVIYGLISFVNHYNFRTFALDLGMFNQALYAFSKGRNAFFTLDTNGFITPFLATHFSPITFLYTPFYYLLGTYSLLFIQIISILWGGYGIYRLSMQLTEGQHKAPLLVLIQFFTTWGVFSALAFDFHNNVVGAMMVPWLAYYFVMRKPLAFALLSGLFLMTQENMALWYPFIVVALLLEFKSFWTKKQLLRLYLPLIVFSIAYVVVVIFYIMPSLQAQTENLQLSRYSHLGASASAIVSNIFLHPLDTIKILFTNILDDPDYDYIKAEFYIALLLSGGYFLLLRPKLLIMLIPIIAQKMLSNNYVFWGTNVQYSIECVPVLCLATISFFTSKKSRKQPILYLSLLLTCITTIRLFDHRISKWYLPENARLYQAAHYRPVVNNEEVRKVISTIPAEVPLAVSSRLAPHLANRALLYHFPVIKNAAYIALFKTENDYWPMDDADSYWKLMEAYRHNADWEVAQETKDIIVFKRR